MAAIQTPAFDSASNGSPLSYYQCEKTHCGKAFPAVADLRAAVNPKDSETGKKAFKQLSGVPATGSSSLTTPLL